MTEMKPRIAPQDLLDALNARYATKGFDTGRKIEDSLWSVLEETLILTPSSWGLQPWKFVVITDQKLKDALLPHAWNQVQVTQCSHLVVFCTQKVLSEADANKIIGLTATLNGIPPETLQGYASMISGSIASRDAEKNLEWSKRQTYLAVDQFLVSCALLGVDACPMEGFMAEEFDEILNIEGFTATVVVPAGYRSPDDKYAQMKKSRYERSELIVYK